MRRKVLPKQGIFRGVALQLPHSKYKSENLRCCIHNKVRVTSYVSVKPSPEKRETIESSVSKW